MKILSAYQDSHVLEAAQAIKAGLLVAFPTETVYGLGADAFNPRALARIFEAKGRPRFDPLIIHIAALEALNTVADLAALDERTSRVVALLCSHLWPGPLTLVLPKQRSIPDLATSGLPTVAVRLPSHSAARLLIASSTGAIAAPSANPFGYLSPTSAEHVRDQLGDRVDIILDGGKTTLGLESTVLDCSGDPPRILRPGGTSREDIEALIGPVASGGGFSSQGEGAPAISPQTNGPELTVPESAPDGLASPGLLKSHYAPRTPLMLHAAESMRRLPKDAQEGMLFFDRTTYEAWAENSGMPPADRPSQVSILSEQGDLREAASELFETLHRMDKQGFSRIHAQEAPNHGLGPAINDRLARASH